MGVMPDIYDEADRYRQACCKANAENTRLTARNAELEEQLRWIPVSEGLPEETGEYLVLPHIENCPVLWYQDRWYWYNHQDDAISDTIGYCEEPIPEITHWMKIPTLPKATAEVRKPGV